jgi:hypothetical protein
MQKAGLFAALVLPGLAAATLATDWEGTFQGTLGTSKIIVQLVEPQEDMEGDTGRETSRYSYLPKTRDINLVLKADDGALSFEETLLPLYMYGDEGTADKRVTGRWELRVSAEQAKGSWQSPDGKKTLPIALSRVAEISRAEAGPERNLPIATYDELWAKTLSFSDAGVAKRFGAVEIRWVKDSAFGITFPLLGAFPDEARKAAANAALLAAHHRDVVRYRECKNGVPIDWLPENDMPEFHYEVSYASPTLLSFSEAGSVFCGGAHPNNYITPITYDLTTGEKMGGDYLLDLSPQGFGRMLKLATKQERMAFERFAMGRWREAAARDTEMDGACDAGWDDMAPEGEKDFKLHLTEAGLAVTRTDYPHVASVCLFTDFNPTVIPWAELKPWLKPGQQLVAIP